MALNKMGPGFATKLQYNVFLQNNLGSNELGLAFLKQEQVQHIKALFLILKNLLIFKRWTKIDTFFRNKSYNIKKK